MGTGVAKFIYFNKSKAYLTLHKGDEVKIIKDFGDGWSEGAIGSQRGLFPSSYVKKKQNKKRSDFTLSMMMDKEELDEIIELEDGNLNESTRKEDIEKMINSFKTIENSSSASNLIDEKKVDSSETNEKRSSKTRLKINPYQRFVSVKFLFYFYFSFIIIIFFFRFCFLTVLLCCNW